MNTHSDLGTSETRAGVEANTISTSTAVDLNLTSVWLEVLSGILSGDTALNGKSTLGDGFLSKTELGQGRASSDLNLRRNDVDAGDFL